MACIGWEYGHSNRVMGTPAVFVDNEIRIKQNRWVKALMIGQ